MEPLPNAELFLACACPQPRCIMQSWRSCGYLLLQLQQSPPGSFREDDALSLSVDHRKAVLVRDGNGYVLDWLPSYSVLVLHDTTEP